MASNSAAVAGVESFPSGFYWGAATAAHQIEGNNIHSDWWRAEQRGQLPYPSGDACRSWELWERDVELLHALKLNAYRLSVEWARIEPEPGQFDAAALDTYRHQLEALHQVGVEPMVTLHHFTLPTWVADRGGWANPATVDLFTRYTQRVAAALGDQVRWWITLNEPSILGLKGYLEGSWPPFRPADLRGYLRLLRTMARGHRAARQALRSVRPDAQAGIAFALWPLEALRRWNPLDQAAALLGDWPGQARLLWRTAPTLDWVGVNYYTRVRATFPPRNLPRLSGSQYSDFDWEIYPRGLANVLRRVGRLGKPVMITENGIADAADRLRASYILAHLRVCHQAIQQGVDLRGYLHWSLMDNFEWAEGYRMRFGLAAVDFASPEKTRTPRPSARFYADVAAANSITPDILARHAAALQPAAQAA